MEPREVESQKVTCSNWVSMAEKHPEDRPSSSNPHATM
jgi:hypothetical protein